MSAKYDRQYRPITTLEVGADDGESVAGLLELQWSMDNYKAHFGPMLIPGNMWAAASGNEPSMESKNDFFHVAGTNTEVVVLSLAHRRVPHGYNKIQWGVQGYMTSGSSGTCSWRMYSSIMPYRGPEYPFDASFLGTYAQSAAIVINSTSHQCPACDEFDLIRTPGGFTFLTVTAQASAGASGEYCVLHSISAQAKLVTA